MEATLTNSILLAAESPQGFFFKNATKHITILKPTSSTDSRKLSISDTEFFDNIDKDVHKIVKNEDRKDAYKRNEPFIADHARSLELKDVLETKVKLIEELQVENEELQVLFKNSGLLIIAK